MTHLRTGVYSSPSPPTHAQGSWVIEPAHRPAYCASGIVGTKVRIFTDAADASDAVRPLGCVIASFPVGRG